ncbi:hypothetical protein FGIG_03245 [Fasciola gigantica]|uniref:CUB domain-containing protein n=1 Tax=Fasciola gigantica TaxID=46835 RepID=A0A504Z212_FASGI|nr:hypothetical protein FGIG_03245 [Fasciola gigantica]
MRSIQISFFLILHTCILLQSSTAQEDRCGQREWFLTEEETVFNVPAKLQFTETTTCTYKVRGIYGTTIALRINSILLGKGGQCHLDNITVAEDESLLGNSTEYTCGTTTANLSVEKNVMVIRIYTSTIPAQSFVNATLIQRLALENPEICGSGSVEFNGKPEILEVPPKDKSFTQPTVCSYRIFGRQEDRLDLVVASMNLRSEGNCKNDYLQVSDLRFDLTRGDKYCDENPPSRPFFTSSNAMFIEFRAQTNPTKANLRAVYYKRQSSQTTNPCGPQVVRLSDKSQYFFVPHGANFTKETTCNYVVIGKPEHKIELEIKSLNLGPTTVCNTDYIKVAESDKALANSNQITCHNQTRTFAVPFNVMFIEIKVKTDFQRSFVRAVLKPAKPSPTTRSTDRSRSITDSPDETNQKTPGITDGSGAKTATSGNDSSAVTSQILVWLVVTLAVWIH